MARKRKKFSCDFETTTDPNDCRVWAYGYMEIGNKKNSKIGNNLDEFMEWCEREKGDCYFHNLRFDGEFIVNWLLKNGYTHEQKKDATGKPKTFTCTISRMGQWYVIDVCYGYKGKEKLHTVFYDSLKKLPFPVKKIAKDFKLEIQKGNIDYDAFRPVGHKITDEELKYINNDIEIVADALEIQFNQGLKKMTNGQDSLTGFKSVISTDYFKRLFPVFDCEFDRKLRKAYRGGFTWVNERFQGQEIREGIVFDVNSLYPSQMYSRPLPYGFPVSFKGKYEEDEEFPLFIQIIECEFHLKEGYIPTIQIKKNHFFKENEYLKSSNGERVKLYVTNIDLMLMQEHYELYDVDYLGGWKFKSKVGLFKEFIDHWMYIKTHSTGAIKALAKLMLNSLYGKFASNPNVTGKQPFLKDDGSVGYRLPYDEEGNIIEEFKDPVYTPMGVFITSWARYTTITTAQKCFDRIIYCDTDSIHLVGIGIPEAIKDIVDPDKLGYWKHESTFYRAKFIRQKTYVEDVILDKPIYYRKGNKLIMTNHHLEVKCAGMPDRIKEKVTFDNFEIGFSSFGKLLPKHVNGGVVLVDTEFTIK
jgi:hypothetical protein